MKITLATAFFLYAFVAFVKANNLVGLGDETVDLEDELGALEIQDAAMGKPKPPVTVGHVIEAFLNCFMNHKGMMDTTCIQKIEELPPSDEKRRLIRCARRSFKNCHKKPKHHEFRDCLLQFNDCLKNGEEGSGY